jgi:menaquinone-specific isochorismate synthase
VNGRTARLYAGCGLVAESDPDSEVREAHAKMLPFREALEGI